MKIDAIGKKYNMEQAERIAFYEFIKKSNYRYTYSFWTGADIDDSQNIDAIVQEFRSGYSKRFISLSESSTITVPEAAQSKLMDCPDCGKKVSRRAQVCIHCGCPLSTVTETAPIQFYGVKKISDKWVMGTAATFLARVWVINKQATGVDDLSIIASGITKERAELLLNYLVAHNGEGELVIDTKCTQENQQVTRYIDATINPNAPVVCPRCRSTEVRIGQRGYSAVSGFIGSGKTTNRCGKCGYTWNPDSLMK